MSKKRVAIDFDGVIHSYTSGWKGPTNIPDPPVPGALEAIHRYIAAGFEVVIFTTRMAPPNNESEVAEAIGEWLDKHGFPTGGLALTGVKVPSLIYIDDRGYRFEGEFPSVRFIEEHRHWWKK